jgi:elongation factor G
MKSIATNDIRNLALVGHGSSGKTSLAEGLLFATGTVSRLGSVDQGSATTDYWEDEREGKHSFRMGLAHALVGDRKLNVLDTPGAGNFIFDARLALSVADTAVVVLDTHSGIEVQTERVWRFSEDAGVPSRFLVLNKMDRENPNWAETVASVQERFGREAVALQVPIGEAAEFRGVVDLVTGRAHVTPRPGEAAVEVGDPPAELADAVASAREALMEMVAESSEELMESFLEAGELSEEALRKGLASAVAAGQLHPIVFTSASSLAGVGCLAQALADLAPTPVARGQRRGVDGEIARACADDQPISMQVFKTLVDPFAGRMSLVRLWSGSLSGDVTLSNPNRGHDEKVHAPHAVQGKDQVKLPDLHAGDIACLLKLKDTLTNDTLCDKAAAIEFPAVAVPEPPISFAIEPKNQGDEEKIGNALHKLAEEDLMLRYQFDPETKELVVSGAADRHVQSVVGLLKSRYKVEVVLHPPRVPYRETIRRNASGSYRHKKQTGGAGQFAEVHMEVVPLESGKGFEFDTGRIFGGSISQNFFASIEKGIKQVLGRGPLAGYPVCDVRCEVFDGKMHPVDSKDIAFQIAGRQLMKQLLLQGSPVLLEPIMAVHVTCPEEHMGDVMGDLSGRRGKPQGMESDGGRQVINALVPLAEMLTYSAQLKSITGGRGDFNMELDHYEAVPGNIQQKLVEEAKAHLKEEEED